MVYFIYSTGFAKEQAETVVSALMSLSSVSLDTVYKDMVTQAQQVTNQWVIPWMPHFLWALIQVVSSTYNHNWCQIFCC